MSMSPVVVVLASQLLFTGSDVLARTSLKSVDGFSFAALVAPWFAVYFVMRQVAVLGQLYVLATVELGRAAGMFAAMSLLAANVIGVLFLGDVLSGMGYVGVTLAVAAVVILTISGNG